MAEDKQVFELQEVKIVESPDEPPGEPLKSSALRQTQPHVGDLEEKVDKREAPVPPVSATTSESESETHAPTTPTAATPTSFQPKTSASLSSLFDITKQRVRKAQLEARQKAAERAREKEKEPEKKESVTVTSESKVTSPSHPEPMKSTTETAVPVHAMKRSTSASRLNKPIAPKGGLQPHAAHGTLKQSREKIVRKEKDHIPHIPPFTSRATQQRRRAEITPFESYDSDWTQTRSLRTSGERDIRFRGQPTFLMEEEYKHMLSGRASHRYHHDEPLPPSAKARHAFHMETVEDEIMGYTSVTEDEFDGETSVTLEDKQNMINQLFGMHPFPVIEEEEITEEEEPQPGEKPTLLHKVCAFLWVVFGGAPLYLAYTIVGGLMALTGIGKDYGDYCFRVRNYVLNPYHKYFIRYNAAAQLLAGESTSIREQTKSTSLLKSNDELGMQNNSAAYYIWVVLASLLLAPLHVIYMCVAWLLVVIAPLSKMNLILIKESYRRNDINSLQFVDELPGDRGNLLFTTHRAGDMHYFGYQLMGVNIVFINSLFIVALTICLHYIFPLLGFEEVHFLILFILSTLSIIPVSYYIGLAIASLSVQSSFAAGAILNASFGSFIELVLYSSAIRAGTLPGLVQASITGTLLGMMLLLPGLSMIAGGLRYKQQRFNRAATGVSTTLLLISVVGAFTPTIFYTAYGRYAMQCENCNYISNGSGDETLRDLDCTRCIWNDEGVIGVDVYEHRMVPLQIAISVILPLAYIAGCIFTLKTHSHIYEEKIHVEHEGEHEGGGHKAPGWSRRFSIIVLFIFAVAFGLISEELVESLGPVLDLLDIPPRFAGLLFISLITSTVEFLNAIIFAYHNDLTLAFEVANSYCVQVALIQMPALVFISLIVNHYQPDNLAFTLLFPVLDLFSVIFALLIMIFSSSEGKSNYFQGLALVFAYLIFVIAFFFVPT